MFNINVRDYTYTGCQTPAVKNILLTLPNSKLYRITGDNGSGKSTFSYLLCGIAPEVIGGKVNGSVLLENEKIDIEVIRNQFSYLFQNPVYFFSGLSCRDELMMVKGRDALFDNMIGCIDIDLPYSKLSMGQQQKFALACALYSDKDIIILDEPFEFLDEPSVLILKQIIENKLAQGKTIFFIDHIFTNSKFNIETHDIVFEKGTIIEGAELGSYDSIEKNRSNKTQLEKLKIAKLQFKYPEQKELLLDIKNLYLFQGEVLGIKGSNGSGKSTLFYLLSGLLKPKQGTVFIDKKIKNYNSLKGSIKMCFQNPDYQLFQNTIRDEIISALKYNGIRPKEIEKKLAIAADVLPFLLDDEPASLSFGQKKLVTILVTYLLEPQILILDEPFASLDITNVKKVLNFINETAAKGISILISSHNNILLNKCCDRVLNFKDKDLV